MKKFIFWLVVFVTNAFKWLKFWVVLKIFELRENDLQRNTQNAKKIHQIAHYYLWKRFWVYIAYIFACWIYKLWKYSSYYTHDTERNLKLHILVNCILNKKYFFRHNKPFKGWKRSRVMRKMFPHGSQTLVKVRS